MKNLKFLFVAFIISAFSCLGGTDCENLPSHYKSFYSAIQTIRSASFKIKESVNTSKSSWVRGASYYSCDGITGFFILETDKQSYLYKGVPIEIWEGFKNADSFGRFYDYNIKGRYQFEL